MYLSARASLVQWLSPPLGPRRIRKPLEWLPEVLAGQDTMKSFPLFGFWLPKHPTLNLAQQGMGLLNYFSSRDLPVSQLGKGVLQEEDPLL